MPVFRKHTPKRQKIVTRVAHYSDHRQNLMSDFQNRCGYCNDINTWRNTWFEIDHFVPKEYLKSITESDYSNLVYSCRSCNNAKRDKWPFKDEKIHNNKKDKGFIDPCDVSYKEQFGRTETGRIVFITPLGEWMFKALKLHKPQHEIIWNIEQADELIDEIEQLLKKNPNVELEKTLLPVLRNFRKYVKQLGDVQ